VGEGKREFERIVFILSEVGKRVLVEALPEEGFQLVLVQPTKLSEVDGVGMEVVVIDWRVGVEDVLVSGRGFYAPFREWKNTGAHPSLLLPSFQYLGCVLLFVFPCVKELAWDILGCLGDDGVLPWHSSPAVRLFLCLLLLSRSPLFVKNGAEIGRRLAGLHLE